MIANKKSVSPLIATVLLIAFAVALGAVVMNWSKSYFETTTQYATEKSDTARMCSMDVSFDVITIGSEKKICYDNSTSQLEITLENRGSVDLDGFKVVVITNDDNITTVTSTEPLSEIEVKKYVFDVDGVNSGEDISQVRITPSAKSTYCPDATLTFRNIPNC